MCNLYSITTNQEAIARLFRVINCYVGNLPPMPGVFTDYPAPVVRNDQREREMAMMRRACRRLHALRPSCHQHPQHVVSHWRGWLRPESRCLVPFNSFAEYAPEQNP